MLRNITYLLLLLFTPIVFAQNPERKVFKNEKKTERFESGVPIVSPFIMPASTPEMGFIISAGALLSFKTKRNNAYLSHSTLPVSLGISPQGAFFASGFLTTYWIDNFIRFSVDGWYKNRDDNYWGVGMDNALEINKGRETTSYHNTSFRIDPILLFRIHNNFYLGARASFSQFHATEISELMMEDSYVLNYGTDLFSSGLGFTAQFDSRDYPTYPESGLVLKFDGLFYGSYLRSNNDFRIFEFDYRQYQKIIREGSLLSWQYKLTIGSENTPWNEMSTFGGYTDMRGYYNGHFRDRNMMLALIEYRHKFFRAGSMEYSRHGLVFWVGGATIFSPAQSIQSPLINMGFGYRFELQPRMNLRIDIGFGTESAGLYLGFNEAF